MPALQLSPTYAAGCEARQDGRFTGARALAQESLFGELPSIHFLHYPGWLLELGLYDTSSLMKVATVADLRNHFARVSRWIEDGEKVEIRKRGKVFATLSPPRVGKGKKKEPKNLQWPDMMARMKKIFPNGVQGKPLSEIISEGRGEW